MQGRRDAIETLAVLLDPPTLPADAAAPPNSAGSEPDIPAAGIGLSAHRADGGHRDANGIVPALRDGAAAPRPAALLSSTDGGGGASEAASGGFTPAAAAAAAPLQAGETTSADVAASPPAIGASASTAAPPAPPAPSAATAPATASDPQPPPPTAATTAVLSPPLSASFAGANYANNQQLAPDCSVAAGTNQIVTTTNDRIDWYDRTGALQSDQSLSSFFNLSPSLSLGDSRVVFDAVNKRFVVETDVWTGGIICLAVSKDDNPNDGWYFTTVNTNLTINGQACWADYPGLATDGKAIYLTARMDSFGADGVINTADDVFEASQLWIVNDGLGSGGLYDGGAAQVSSFAAGTVTGGTSTSFGQPAQILSPTGSALGTYLVAVNPNGNLQIISISNPTTAPSFLAQNIAGPSPGSIPAGAVQPGTAAQIELHTIGNAVYRNGQLYTASVVVPTSGPDAGLPQAYWYRLDATNPAALTLADQGSVSGAAIGAGAGVETYQPAISVNGNGGFLVGFNASGPGLYAGAYYAVHSPGDPAGSIERPQTLHQGTASYDLTNPSGVVRWGDYSSAAADPVDTSTFWVFNQYAATPSSGQAGAWATQIGAVGPSGAAGPQDDFNGDGRADVVLQQVASGQAWLWEMAGTGIIGGGSIATPGPEWRVAGEGDFNGDGHADIVLQDWLSSQVWQWQMQGAQIIGGGAVATPGVGWRVAATGDFNADGRSDIVLQNGTSRQVWLWEMQGTQIIGGGAVATLGAGWQVMAAGDVNGDGRADLVLQNSSTSALWVWEMNGNAIVGGGAVGTPGLGWRVVATADLNGDGNADLVLQNSMTGEVGVDLMAGNAVIGFAAIGSAGPQWHVTEVADFVGNGSPDILLQNGDTSQSWLWTLTGTAITGGGAVATPGAGWQVAAGQPPLPAPATRDFNGDARADIVLDNSQSGQAWLWEMNGASIIGSAAIASPGTSWQVVGEGDFDGDGNADVLLQNSADGGVWLWQMQGSAIIGGGAVGTPAAGWRVAGTGDLDGDGRADIVLQNGSSGQLWLWQMNGNAITGGGAVASPGAGWRLAATADLNGDGKADLVLQNGGTGALWVYEMNGLTIVGGGSAGNPGAGWQVVTAADFNHDGMADLVLQNTQTGEVGVDEMSGITVLGFADIGTPAAGYTVKSAADYSGDGSPDLLLQNDATLDTVLWTLSGTTLTAATDIATPPAGWHIPVT